MTFTIDLSRRFGASIRLNSREILIVGREWLRELIEQGGADADPYIRLPFCGLVWVRH